MEISYSPLYKEAQDFLSNSGKSQLQCSVVLLFKNGEKLTLPNSLMAENITRDYVAWYADEMTVTVKMGLGQYSRQLYPNREGLQATLTWIESVSGTRNANQNAPKQTRTFHALLLDDFKAPVVGQGTENVDEQTLDLGQLIDVNFQLIDKALQPIQATMVGGIVDGELPSKALLTHLTLGLASINVETDYKLAGIDMIPADANEVKKQMSIPHSTALHELPDFIQKKYGVYNSGIGSYIQGTNWYIYSLYNTKVHQKAPKTLTAVILPKRKFYGIETTYLVSDGVVRIAITDDVVFKDDGGGRKISRGNGFRYNDPQALIAEGIVVKDNQLYVRRNVTTREVKTEEAVHEVNYAPTVEKTLSANPFVHYSEMAKNNGGYMLLTWQNSDASLITPGMPIKILYADQDQTKIIYGVVHGVLQHRVRVGDYNTPAFQSKCTLTVFTNRQVSSLS